MNPDPVEIFLETGKTRVFAGAPGWPGWCRSGRNEAEAIQHLFEAGLRYARALETVQLSFKPPSRTTDFVVVERLAGNATTDFGAPGASLADDARPISPLELQHMQMVLEACWKTVDLAVEAAAGRPLRKGPRGGGRDLAKLVEHIYDVDAAYLVSLGGKPGSNDRGDIGRALTLVREDIRNTLNAAVQGKVAERGPRGGLRWKPRYFVRRLAWHELDHAWEIEDRVE